MSDMRQHLPSAAAKSLRECLAEIERAEKAADVFEEEHDGDYSGPTGAQRIKLDREIGHASAGLRGAVTAILSIDKEEGWPA